MRTSTDCWAPYRDAIDERLGACEDLLGRLRRSLAGEIAPDRLYFADKAHSLRDAAQALVDQADDIEWWLGACAADVPGEGEECGRSAGHPGAHQPEGRCAEQRVLADARAVAAELRQLTDRLAWGLLAVRAQAGVAEPRALAGELRAVQRRLSRTASSVAALAAAPAVAAEDEP